MPQFAKITRGQADTGERKFFPEGYTPPGPDDLSAGKPYWVPVETDTVDNSTGDKTQSAVSIIVEETRIIQRTTITNATVTADDVEAERDRRLQLDFTFNGVVFQRDTVAAKRINGAGTLALAAIVSGAQPGDYRWHGEDTDFEWIAKDNSLVKMDAQTVLAFGQAAAKVETRLVFASKALKAMEPIPADYASNESYWS